mmetsp:Transcript_7531/g.10408  ORF Transcript_7531/g.10408 Transcript_7531/m.10408 type:complete len:173 (-) Transcript_7531:55-573(-)
MKRDRKKLNEIMLAVARNLTALSAAIAEMAELDSGKHEESSTSEVDEAREEERPKKRQRSTVEKEDDLENEIANIFDKDELDAIEASLQDQDWANLDDFFAHITNNKIVSPAHGKEKIRRVAQVFYGIWDYERQQQKKQKAAKQAAQAQKTPAKSTATTPGTQKQKPKQGSQ